MKAKKIVSFMLCFVLLISIIPISTFAWKAKTHNYIANLVLEEAASTSQVTIAPFGNFNIDYEFLYAIKQYPAAFRAGAQGPDAYPDIYVGQTYIHPKEGKTSGEWLRMMCEDALKIPQNDPKRYEIISFMLGFMCHYAGDLFGHNYINEIAGGSYPALTDLADPAKSEEALNIILKHLSSEGYIDSKIPVEYKMGEKVNLNAPKDFILGTFIYNGHKNNGISTHYDSQYIPKHLFYIVELRDSLYKKADYYRAYSNSSNIFDYLGNTTLVNYLDRWIGDLDRALSAWIQVSENIAKGIVDQGEEGDMIIVKNEISTWFDQYGKYMTPFPDVIVDVLGAPATFAKFLKEQMGITYFYDKYETFKKQIEEMILNYMIYDVAGLKEEQIQKMREALSAPQLILGDEVLAQMDEEMGNFGTETALTANDQEFAPFYNSLIMTKLILIGPSGLNELIQKATNGAYSNTQYVKSVGKNMIDNLKVTVKTRSNKTKWGIPYTNYGTDDDIYFGVRLKNGRTIEQLFDKSGVNDFNSGNQDTYDFSLNTTILPSDISQIWLRKKSIADDDWNPEYVEMKGYYGSMSIMDMGRYSDLPEIRDNNSWSQNVSYGLSTYSTSLSTGIIDFMESLDGSLQWKNENSSFFLWNNETLRQELFYKIFKDVEKYDDPNYGKEPDPIEDLDPSEEDPNVDIDPSEEDPNVDLGPSEEDLNDNEEVLDIEPISFEGASGWAIPELEEAYHLNLFTDKVKGNYQNNITRAEFAGLVVKLYEAMTGQTAMEAPFDTFSDTQEEDVLKAYQLKIVGGVGQGLFAPDRLVTREQMAVMFYNTISVAFSAMVLPMNETDGVLTISDKDLVSSWATRSVDFVFELEIMKGNGSSFNPKGNATREAAIVVVKRVFNRFIQE